MFGGWGEFLLALAVFLLSHVIPMRPALKGPLIAALGRGGYIAAYSLLSLALFWWLLMAAGRAPAVMLWPHALWQRWVVNLAMPLAILLAVFAVGARNPFSFGGTAAGYDPRRPGVTAVTRHPLMTSFALWAGAHLLANGDLAHVVLFGLLLLFALAGIAAAEMRARRALPEFARLAAPTSLVPFSALLTGRAAWSAPSAVRLAIAGAIWLSLLWLHGPLIGAPPLP